MKNDIDFNKIRQGIPLTFRNPLGNFLLFEFRFSIFDLLFFFIESYGYAKLANCFCAQTLAKRFKEEGSTTTTYSLHPGAVATDIWRTLPSFIGSVIKKFMV